MSTLIDRSTLVVETCYKCGIRFAMPGDFQETRYRDKATWYCPNGHGQAYRGKTYKQEIADLQEEVNRERTRTANARAFTESVKRSLVATKGHLTRTKKHISNGKCPCCRRNFQNLQRHMKTQHPDYGGQKDETG